MTTGWLCPSCHKAHAPSVLTCPEPTNITGFPVVIDDSLPEGTMFVSKRPPCANRLRFLGLAAPRTCDRCGLGPCSDPGPIAKPGKGA